MIKYAIITDNSAQGLEEYPYENVDLFTINLFKKNVINHINPVGSGKWIIGSITGFQIDKSIPSESIQQLLHHVNLNYDEVFCILSAGCLTHINELINETGKKSRSRSNFHLIDSQTLSGGLGYLINMTIRMIHNKKSPGEIDISLREKIPNIYTLLCSRNLSALYTSNFIDAGQLIMGEQHSIIPLFSLENGMLNSLEKFKNFQGLLEYLTEFLEEFEKIDQLVLIHPAKSNTPLFQEIMQFVHQNNEVNSLLEVKSNDFLSNLIGSDGFGLILVE